MLHEEYHCYVACSTTAISVYRLMPSTAGCAAASCAAIASVVGTGSVRQICQRCDANGSGEVRGWGGSERHEVLIILA